MLIFEIRNLDAGGIDMLDVIYIASFIVGFLLIKYFTDWCEKQINKN